MKFLLLSLLSLNFLIAKPAVTTTLAPYAYAIEKIAGNEYDVHILISESSNPHIYESRPQDIKNIMTSSLWFCSDEQIEKKITHGVSAKKIRLNQDIEMISSGHHHCHHCDNLSDLHTWMSPEIYLKQSKLILTALCEKWPENKHLFEKNYESLETELNELIKKTSSYAPKDNQDVIFVSHASYAYLCKDLHMKQLSLETEGKEAGMKQIQSVYESLKTTPISNIFAQVQHSDVGAKRLAELTHANVVKVNPYQKNYPRSIEEILEKLP